MSVENDLVKTEMSQFIEERVNGILPQGTAQVRVRVLSSAPTNNIISEKLTKFLEAANVKVLGSQLRLPYRSRTLGCFQENENGDALFFIVYFQEYGADCPLPNRNAIYMAMLDSAQVFSPRNLRRSVYYMVLTSYFKYMKKRGFEAVFWWSCPPTDGSEYVFHHRPLKQKVQTLKELNKWYKGLLEVAKTLGVVEDYMTLYDFLPSDLLQFFNQFPLFVEDHWLEQVEEAIRKVETGEYSGPAKSIKRKRSSNGKGKAVTPPQYSIEQLVHRQLVELLRRLKDSFYYISLGTVKKEIDDKEPIILSELMQSRDNLYNFLKSEELESRDVLQCTKTTMKLLSKLRREQRIYTCMIYQIMILVVAIAVATSPKLTESLS